MPYQQKVPQNIDIQDKIFGPFTLQQFLYMLGGGAIIYILFSTVAQTNFLLFLILSIPIGIFSLALALVRVNERPFLTFLGYALVFAFEPKIKTWQKSIRLREMAVRSAEEVQASQQQVAQPRMQKGVLRSRLSQLAGVIDNKGAAGAKELGQTRIFDVSASTEISAQVDETRIKVIFSEIRE